MNKQEYSVSEISNSIKKILQGNFSNIKIRGEISGYKGQYSSGHAYFALKEKDAKIDAVIWKTVFNNLRFQPQEGLEVVACGSISSYAPSSKYNLTITSLEPAGVGSLMALFEKLKKKLTLEGLFDEKHKKKLPFLPKIIGVVTSAKGAVIHDILHRLNDRFGCRIIIWDVSVQGAKSASEIEAAIQGFNNLPTEHKPDLLIVARGGGSIEDLWSFNEEAVVRAAFFSKIPLISAVGHETDFTLLDLVADLRAPTPTAAAEIALPLSQDLYGQLIQKQQRLNLAIERKITKQIDDYSALKRALPNLEYVFSSFWRKIDEQTQYLKHNFEKIYLNKINLYKQNNRIFNIGLIERIFKQKKEKLYTNARLLQNISYNKILQRGFTLLLSEDNKPISSINNIALNQEMTLKFYDGDATIIAQTKRSVN